MSSTLYVDHLKALEFMRDMYQGGSQFFIAPDGVVFASCWAHARIVPISDEYQAIVAAELKRQFVGELDEYGEYGNLRRFVVSEACPSAEDCAYEGPCGNWIAGYKCPIVKLLKMPRPLNRGNNY